MGIRCPESQIAPPRKDQKSQCPVRERRVPRIRRRGTMHGGPTRREHDTVQRMFERGSSTYPLTPLNRPSTLRLAPPLAAMTLECVAYTLEDARSVLVPAGMGGSSVSRSPTTARSFPTIKRLWRSSRSCCSTATRRAPTNATASKSGGCCPKSQNQVRRLPSYYSRER